MKESSPPSKVEVEGTGSYPTTGACNTATVWDLNSKFASGITVTFVGVPNGGNAGKPTGESWAHEKEWREKYGPLASHGTVFEGADGWCMVDRGQIVTAPESLHELETDTLPVQLKVSAHHAGDFLDSIKSRQPAIAHVDDAVWGDTLCYIGDIAARLQRKVTFDFRDERFIGDAEANQRLGLRAMRPPWHL